MRKKTNKKLTGLLLAVLVCASALLSACGGTGAAPAASTQETGAGASAEASTEASAEASTEASAEASATEASSEAETESTIDPDAEIVLGDYRNIAPGVEDAYYCSVILYVWEPLITMDEKGEPAAKLAKSWEMSEDAKTWTFKLQEGVKFHDGEDFNADAVLANFERYRYEVKSSNFYPLNVDSYYPNLDQVNKIDDYTVELTFTQPAPTLLYTMTNFGSPMYSPACFDDEYNFTDIAQGTGPFRITENVKDEYVLLERNDDYWGEKAKAKTIRVRTIPDVNTRFSAMKSEEIMGVMDLNAITAPLAVELTGDDQFALTTTNSTMIYFLCLNGKSAPFDDVRMRKAVSLMIDRETMEQNINLGYASPTCNILNYSTPFYKELPVEYDPEKARELAAEVLGDERVEVKYLIQEGSDEQKAEAEIISAALAELGIDCTIETYDWATIREMMKEGDYGIARGQQGLSNMEALTIFKRFMYSEGDHNNNYSLGADTPEIDALIEEADAEIDIARRSEIYDELQEISVERQPVVPIYNGMTIYVYNKKLAGYQAQIYGLDLPEVHWAE